MEAILRWASILSFLLAAAAQAESGYDAWLRYPPPQSPVAQVITVVGNSPILESARQELTRGLRTTGMEIVLRTASGLKPVGYSLKMDGGKIVVTGSNDRGVLYGAFALLRKVALSESLIN